MIYVVRWENTYGRKVSEYCEEQRKKNVAPRNELRALGNDSIFTKKTE